MFKKIVSLMIAMMIVMSIAAISVSAAQVEIGENAADTPAEVGAEGGADTGAESGADTGAAGQKIYFDASTTGWNNYSIIMVYCYEPESGDIQIDWAAKKKGGMKDEGNDIWSYDFAAKGITLDANKQYAIIFNADTGAQTCDLLMDSTCFGDTAICNKDVMIENTADSNKKSVEVRWKGGQLGPMKAITSLGHIVGDVVPAYTSPYKMFVKFLASLGKDGLQNALNYSNGKTAQEVIDETAANLGLKKDDVKQAIAEAAKPADDRTDSHDWSKDWDESKSSLPSGTNEETHTQGDGKKDNSSSGGSGSGSGSEGGSDSGSGSEGGSDSASGGSSGSDGSSGGSGSSGSSGASGSGASGGSSGSGGASGSGDGASTGQETTILFIMLGVMVVAVGAIVLLRKKNRS